MSCLVAPSLSSATLAIPVTVVIPPSLVIPAAFAGMTTAAGMTRNDSEDDETKQRV
jgi:hypothetical protein